MQDTIYLVVDRRRVDRMTKTLPSVGRGEIPIKLILTVAETAFREPVLERKVEINDWREGVDMADVEFRGQFITQEEADLIKTRRLEKMREILEDHGFTVEAPEENEADGSST